MPRVLIADDLSPRAAEILHRAGFDAIVRVGLKKEDLLAVIGEFDGLAVRSATQVTAEVLEAGRRLQIVGRAGIGVDNIDVKAASRRGVIVMNTPGGNAVTTAEHALALMMSLARKIPAATASVKAGKWEKKRFQGTELAGKSIGVLGLGNIGRIVADRALGLRMHVLAFDPFLTEEAARKLGVEPVTLAELLARADVITVHTPLMPETKGLIGADAFGRMKKGVLLINAARGGIVDELALVEALKSGKVAGAALDVFEQEPVDPAHPLLALDNVVCTPHLGASTEEAQEKVAIEVAEQMVDYFARGEVRGAVNVPSVSREARERLGPWLDLVGRLARFQSQLLEPEAGLTEISLELAGDFAGVDSRPLLATAVSGVLSRHLDVAVNSVNAPLLAEERGIRVTETRLGRGVTYTQSIGLSVRGRDGVARTLRGALFTFAGKAEPRLVEVGDFVVEVLPEGRLLIVRNQDRPGVIGALGTLLGSRGINVSRMQVGLAADARASGADALQIWNVDGELDATLLSEIRRLPHVKSAQRVEL